MKGFIQKIKDGDNVIHLTKEESDKYINLFRIISEIPISKCHGAPINIEEDGYVCIYCGEICELTEPFPI